MRRIPARPAPSALARSFQDLRRTSGSSPLLASTPKISSGRNAFFQSRQPSDCDRARRKLAFISPGEHEIFDQACEELDVHAPAFEYFDDLLAMAAGVIDVDKFMVRLVADEGCRAGREHGRSDHGGGEAALLMSQEVCRDSRSHKQLRSCFSRIVLRRASSGLSASLAIDRKMLRRSFSILLFTAVIASS